MSAPQGLEKGKKLLWKYEKPAISDSSLDPNILLKLKVLGLHCFSFLLIILLGNENRRRNKEEIVWLKGTNFIYIALQNQPKIVMYKKILQAKSWLKECKISWHICLTILYLAHICNCQVFTHFCAWMDALRLYIH